MAVGIGQILVGERGDLRRGGDAQAAGIERIVAGGLALDLPDADLQRRADIVRDRLADVGQDAREHPCDGACLGRAHPALRGIAGGKRADGEGGVGEILGRFDAEGEEIVGGLDRRVGAAGAVQAELACEFALPGPAAVEGDADPAEAIVIDVGLDLDGAGLGGWACGGGCEGGEREGARGERGTHGNIVRYAVTGERGSRGR